MTDMENIRNALMDEAATKLDEKNAEIKSLHSQLSDCNLAREQLAAEVERLRKNVECLTNNKWSEIEIALGEKEGHDLWMKLHNITSLDDLRRDAERATAAEAALAEAVKEIERLRAWSDENAVVAKEMLNVARAAAELQQKGVVLAYWYGGELEPLNPNDPRRIEFEEAVRASGLKHREHRKMVADNETRRG